MWLKYSITVAVKVTDFTLSHMESQRGIYIDTQYRLCTNEEEVEERGKQQSKMNLYVIKRMREE